MSGLIISPPCKSTFSIKSLVFAGILVGNCLLNVAKVFKMLNFYDRDWGSKVIGRSYFQIQNFSILIADLTSL